MQPTEFGVILPDNYYINTSAGRRSVRCQPEAVCTGVGRTRLGLTSAMSGATRLLSVTRVTVVSVKVDLVMVSVTRPRVAGGGGSMAAAPARSTVTRTPLEGGSVLVARGPPRKCAGIIAWKSSFVIGRGCAVNTFTSNQWTLCG